MELKEGVIARIVNDQFPENTGKRVLLRSRPTTGILSKEDLAKANAWLVWPIDDVVTKGLHDHLAGKTLFKGLQETYLFHLVLKDTELEVLPSDNDGYVTYTFTQNPLQHLLDVGMNGHETN